MAHRKLTTREKGIMGEEIGLKFLLKKGFLLVEKNYLKKWGEIDIIAKKAGTIHFFEVKSTVIGGLGDFSVGSAGFRAEENVHVLKQRRLKRTIQTYLLERGFSPESAFFFHILVVKMNSSTRRAKVSMIENVIL